MDDEIEFAVQLWIGAKQGVVSCLWLEMKTAWGMKLAVCIIKIVQAGSVAGFVFMALCPDKLFGKWISFPYPWLVSGFLICAVASSLSLSVMGALKRAQYGLLLIFGALLGGALLAH